MPADTYGEIGYREMGTDVTSGVVYQKFGPVPASARDEAETMMRALAKHSPRPVILARIKVIDDDQRDQSQRSVVEATMDVSGRVIRAQAAAANAIDAIRLVGNRLERRLNRLAGRLQRAIARPPPKSSGTWRSGDLSDQRPEYYERPPEDRAIVRRKTYSPEERISVSEALFDLEVLDYHFFLFTDEADGMASIVYEGDNSVVLRKMDGSRPDEETVGPEIMVDETPAPAIAVSEARSRLNISNAPFLFFDDAGHGGAVMYRRYDGHYGLVIPRLAMSGHGA